MLFYTEILKQNIRVVEVSNLEIEAFPHQKNLGFNKLSVRLFSIYTNNVFPTFLRKSRDSIN